MQYYNSIIKKRLSSKELNLIKKIINQNDLEKQRNYLIKLSGLLYSRDEKLAMETMEALAKVLIPYKNKIIYRKEIKFYEKTKCL